MKTVEVAAGTLEYREEGDPHGPPVVLLHGLLMNDTQWNLALPLLPGTVPLPAAGVADGRAPHPDARRRGPDDDRDGQHRRGLPRRAGPDRRRHWW